MVIFQFVFCRYTRGYWVRSVTDNDPSHSEAQRIRGISPLMIRMSSTSRHMNYDSIPQWFSVSPYVVPIGFHTDPLHGSAALHAVAI
jgi:hypothetical protein